VGRLGSGMRVSASFQIISRPVGQLGLGLPGLGSGPHVVGRLALRMRVRLVPVFSCGRSLI